MALADSVPGVSGGTVAFLLGFYDQFIDSIDDLITGNMEKKKTAFFFLIKLGIGWVTGMILAILILANVFESHIYAISSLFIGFIIFAIPIVVREELDTLKGKYAYCPFVLVGAAIVCAITYFNPVGGGNSVNLEHLRNGASWYFRFHTAFNYGTLPADRDGDQGYPAFKLKKFSDSIHIRMWCVSRYFQYCKADP